jgi:hypothetical protein
VTANVVAQGYVVPPDGYSLIYPAFAVNKAGTGLIGFTISNPDANAPSSFPTAALSSSPGSPGGPGQTAQVERHARVSGAGHRPPAKGGRAAP